MILFRLLKTENCKKDLKDQYIGMNINQEVRIRTRRKNIDIFFESKFVGVNRLLILVCSNVDGNSKNYKAKTCYLATWEL